MVRRLAVFVTSVLLVLAPVACSDDDTRDTQGGDDDTDLQVEERQELNESDDGG